MQYGAGGARQGASTRGLRVRAGCQDCLWAPVGPPGGADRGPQGEGECSGTDPHRRGLPRLGMQPQTGHAFDPRGSISLGDQLRPFPDPIPRVEPAAHAPSGACQPLWRREFHGQRGATPPRATPALGTRGGLASCPQRTPAPGAQDGGPYRRRDVAVWIDRTAACPRVIAAYDALDTGPRAHQEGGHRGRMAARRTQPSPVPREQRAIPRPAPCGTHLGLGWWGHSEYGCARHGEAP
jgi:hypothetical protein